MFRPGNTVVNLSKQRAFVVRILGSTLVLAVHDEHHKAKEHHIRT